MIGTPRITKTDETDRCPAHSRSTSRFTMWIGAVGIALASACTSSPRAVREDSTPAELAVVGTRIFTSESEHPWVEALAVKDGKFVYVGDRRGLTDFIGPGTRVLEARDQMITPGFVDNHAHVLWIGALTSLVPTDLYDCTNLEQVQAFVRNRASAHPDLPLIGGLGWNDSCAPGAKPHRSMLDAVISDRPVLLMSHDGHSGWANTFALELFRNRNPKAFAEMGPVRDEKTAEYTGIFLHSHSFNPFAFFAREEMIRVEERMFAGMDRSLADALSFGVTTMNDVQMYRDFLPTVLKFRARGGLKAARVRGSYYIAPHIADELDSLREELNWWKALGVKESDEHLVLGDSVKLYIDGVFGNRTALISQSYPDAPGAFGEARWSQEGFDKVIELVDGMGIQACTHAAGDAGIRRVLNSYERVQSANGARDLRHRIEHCQAPTKEDQVRMGRLGILAAMQPLHYLEETPRSPSLEAIWHPWRSLIEANVDVSFGSDWSTSPINPIYGLLMAAARDSSEAIGIEEGIRRWTIASARALKMEDRVGSIRRGKRADFVLFAKDLTRLVLTASLPESAMDDLVLATFVDGQSVYQHR